MREPSPVFAPAATPPEEPAALTPDEQRKGMRAAQISQVLGAHLSLFLGYSAITPLYIKRLGGSDLHALLPSVFIALGAGLQLPVAMFVRPRNIRTFLVRCWFLSSLPVLFALGMGLAFEPGPLAVGIVLTGVLASQAFGYIGATFWFPLLHDVVPPGQRGRFFGKMRAMWSAVYLVLGIFAGLFLGEEPPQWKFVAVLGGVTLLQFLREPFVARIPLRRHNPAPLNWRADWRDAMSRRDLLAFIVYFSVLLFLSGFIGQPTVLYMRQLGYSAGQNTMIYAMSTVGSALALLVAGVLIDRVGTKRVFLGVHLVLAALALGLAAAGELPRDIAAPLLTGLLIVSGAALAVSSLASTTQIFHLTPERNKPFCMNLATSLTMLGAGLSPMLTGIILDSRLGGAVLKVGPLEIGMLQVLFISAGLGLLLAISLLPFVQDMHPGAKIMEDGGDVPAV